MDKGKTKIRVSAPKKRLSITPKRPVRTSWSVGFLITLNTNVKPKTSAEATLIGNDMQRIADLLFTEENIPSWVTFRTAEGRADLIDDVKVDANAEVGPQKGRVHQHISVLVDHRIPPKGIYMNRNGILAFYRQHATTEAVRNLKYIDLKAFTNPNTIRNYLFKNESADKDKPEGSDGENRGSTTTTTTAKVKREP